MTDADSAAAELAPYLLGTAAAAVDAACVAGPLAVCPVDVAVAADMIAAAFHCHCQRMQVNLWQRRRTGDTGSRGEHIVLSARHVPSASERTLGGRGALTDGPGSRTEGRSLEWKPVAGWLGVKVEEIKGRTRREKSGVLCSGLQSSRTDV